MTLPPFAVGEEKLTDTVLPVPKLLVLPSTATTLVGALLSEYGVTWLDHADANPWKRQQWQYKE
jgi:hypothetical protein